MGIFNWYISRRFERTTPCKCVCACGWVRMWMCAHVDGCVWGCVWVWVDIDLCACSQTVYVYVSVRYEYRRMGVLRTLVPGRAGTVEMVCAHGASGTVLADARLASRLQGRAVRWRTRCACIHTNTHILTSYFTILFVCCPRQYKLI